MEYEHTRHESVKCVVVGDTAVGKTRLICARACNAFVTLPQVFSTHVPTVWAIDQYRIHREVLRRSWNIVDGVDVSLRLWDTFGDHDKDRKFAYGRADVIILCYSVANRLSLRNCKVKWFPEIRHYCPSAPIILVGCKNDLRHIRGDKAFLELCREKGSFYRIIRADELVSREEGRQAADEIGVEYYEASALTKYGIEEVFENGIRLALIARRHTRFWVKNLKNVRTPIVQMPYCPPQPPFPKLMTLDSSYESDFLLLLDKGYFPDIRLLAGNCEFHAHKAVLAASSSYFHQVFISSLVVGTSGSNEEGTIRVFQRLLSPTAMQILLRFLYTGTLTIPSNVVFKELTEFANMTNIAELKAFLGIYHNQYDYICYEEQRKYQWNLQENMRRICLQNEVFTDVIFQLENGRCSANRSILMARSDFMASLFSGAFEESSAPEVSLPTVSIQTFRSFLHYVYTDHVEESINLYNCLDILQYANMLCLPHLVTLVENHIREEIAGKIIIGADLTHHFFRLLEPCQVHNAHQLSEFCQYYIITNYQEISQKSSNLLRDLHPENQAYLNINRWPPIHYIKEYDFYERCVRDQELKQKPPGIFQWKNATRSVNGCLWFWGKGKDVATPRSLSPCD